MGWNKGSHVADNLIHSLNKWSVGYDARVQIYMSMIQELEHLDWDCQEESMGSDRAFDDAMHRLHPDWSK